jgi:hypothetical protein
VKYLATKQGQFPIVCTSSFVKKVTTHAQNSRTL